MIRAYLSQWNGLGTGVSPFRTIISNTLPTVEFRIIDGRVNPGLVGGIALVVGNVTNPQHATLLATVGVTYFPFETSGGAYIGIKGLINEVSVANRNIISGIADAHHVPVIGLKGTDGVYFILRRFKLRFLMRQILKNLDLNEGLDTLISDIPAARRQNINERLINSGFSSKEADIQLSDTVREGLVKLMQEREDRDRDFEIDG
jgi:hypothetical protein